MTTKNPEAPISTILVTVLVLNTLAGCATDESSRVGDTAAGGAAIGAGLGLFIGALRGDPLAGLAVGTAVGASQGAYEGWKQDQDDARTRELAAAIRESNQSASQAVLDPAVRAREELTRFLGVWTMEGWAQEPGEERFTIRARVDGTVEMSYFVELAYIDVELTGYDFQIWGASTLGYDESSGYNISTRFNTVPEPLRLTGQFDQANRTFTFEEADARVTVRFENPDRFTAETVVTANGRDVTVESYRFTRI